jgi:hypothetical protein
MNQIVNYLESKQAIFHGALVLMALYVPHAGHLFMKLEHLDMTFSGYSFLNWAYGVGLAAVIEFLILIFLINGYKNTGKFYAVVSFFLNFFYYDYWYISIQDPSCKDCCDKYLHLPHTFIVGLAAQRTLLQKAQR